MSQVSIRRDLIGPILLVATGYADAYTFLEHGRVFAEAMTGNLVLIAVGAFRPSIVPFWRPLVTYATFACGVALAWAVIRHQARASGGTRGAAVAAGGAAADPADRPTMAQLITLALEAAMLTAVGFVAPGRLTAFVAPAIALVSGMQITSFRRVEEEAFTTTVMTTNSMRAVSRGLSALLDHDGSELASTAVMAGLVGAFAAGAFLGGWLSTVLGTHAAWIDAALFAAVGVLAATERGRAGRRAPRP